MTTHTHKIIRNTYDHSLLSSSHKLEYIFSQFQVSRDLFITNLKLVLIYICFFFPYTFFFIWTAFDMTFSTDDAHVCELTKIDRTGKSEHSYRGDQPFGNRIRGLFTYTITIYHLRMNTRIRLYKFSRRKWKWKLILQLKKLHNFITFKIEPHFPRKCFFVVLSKWKCISSPECL